MNQNHKHLFGRPGGTSVHCTPGRPIHLEKAMNKDQKRFWSKVEKGPSCWNWTALLNPKGYGLAYMNGKLTSAHRVAWKFLRGEIPKFLVIDHLCRNRKCMNPDHMEPVTNKENVLRGIGRTAVNARKTECINGHKFTKENTYVYKTGMRNCRICMRMHSLIRRLWKN